MTRRTLWIGVACGLLITSSTSSATTAAAQETYEPARFGSGAIPGQPPLASTGARVVVELKIAPSGIVTDTVVVDDGPPYTEAITKAARTWRFRPAREEGAAVFGKALVVGVFRPPVLIGSELPKSMHVQESSEDVPYPTVIATPVFPPTALYEGVALVEVEIDEAGGVREAALRTTDEAYDTLALETVKKFRFRPARRNGRPVPSYALVFFGFRQPHTPTKHPRR